MLIFELAQMKIEENDNKDESLVNAILELIMKMRRLRGFILNFPSASLSLQRDLILTYLGFLKTLRYYDVIFTETFQVMHDTLYGH